MFRATEEIYDAFQSADLNCEKKEQDDVSYVVAGVSTKLTKFNQISKESSASIGGGGIASNGFRKN